MITVPRSSLTVPGTPTRFGAMGDSLTDTAGPEGSYTGSLAPLIADAAASAGIVAPSPLGAMFPTTITPTAPFAWFNVGKSGYDCIDMIDNDIPAQMIALKPDVVLWCLFGRNCAFGRLHGGVPSRATCAANHVTIPQMILSALPRCQILMTSPVCEGEQWPDGANASDSELDAQDGIQATAAGTVGATYYSLRQPGVNNFFEMEQRQNPTKLNIGVASVDGVHIWSKTSPPPAFPGQLWASQLLLPLFTFE